MTDVVMPRLSDTMEEGTVLRWLKTDGDTLQRGEELVEIETDKATMTYESDQAGVLEIVAGEGDTLPVGALIARIGGPMRNGAAASTPAPAPAEPKPAAEPEPEPEPEPAASDTPPAPTPPLPPAADTPVTAAGERVKASPLARRIAEESGIDLHTLSGSGPGGRIVKADVQAATPAPAGASPPEKPTTAKGETSVQELSRTQQTIARRMAESKATIPDFTLHIDVDMEACVALRTQLKALSQPEAPTYNDMVVKACALALRDYPRANASYRDARFELHSRVNVGVAVAAHDALVVPTVFDADTKSLGEIARETRALAERVRSGEITPPELGGGTFTVSNLGMYGVHSFTAIINPPQVAILSVGALAPRAVVHDGEIVARNTMTVTLACDHRILYGADAAQFLGRIRELLEQPAALTL
ncbi:MAG TPA: dihydrolipoamide acetyltransferase family protein [Solirubrobacteraceae bacterium]|nr:dihydrolipoamide acetyltransferase family protein [Solirubrobacteraceae bacterium]